MATKIYRQNSIDPNILESTQEFNLPRISYSEFLADKISHWNPNTLALIDSSTDTWLTYYELHARAQEFALALLEFGITERDVINFFSENSLEMVIALVGVMYLGVTFSPISPNCHKYDFAHSIEASLGTVLVFGSNKRDILDQALKVPELAQILTKQKLFIQLDLDDEGKKWSHEKINFSQLISFKQAISRENGKTLSQFPHFSPVSAPEVHHLFYATTSGTSGPPKRVIHSHSSFLAQILGSLSQKQSKEGSRFSQWTPLGHYSGLLALNLALSSGICSVLIQDDKLEPILQIVQKFKIHTLALSPDLAILMAKEDFGSKFDLSSLTALIYGSSRLSNSIWETLLRKYKLPIKNIYGSVECSGHLIQDEQEMGPEQFFPGSCGRVGPGVQLKIINEAGGALPTLAFGEICFRASQLFLAYLNDPKSTQEARDEGGWFHTGDLGFYDEEGRLFITDRLNEMIKYKCHSISPAEIEAFLLEYDGVSGVAVVGVPHEVDGNWLRAYVQVIPGKEVSEQELIDFVADNLATQKQLLGGVRFLDQLPLTENGKILRSTLKNLVKEELLC